VAVRPSPELEASSYRVLIDEIPVHRGRIPPDEVLVLAPPDDLELVGIPSRPTAEPIAGVPAAVVARGDGRRAAALGRVCEPAERLLAEVAGALRRHAHHLIGVQDVQCLLDDLEPTVPALVREVSRQLSSSVLAEVLRRLVEEGVSIRPLRVILESILQAGASAGAGLLTEACRKALRGQLGHAHARGGPLSVLLLDPSAEQAIREALAGEMLALEPRRALALLDALAAELCSHPSTPVVLVSPDVRRAVRSLFAPRFPRLPVLAFEELPPELPVRPVGRIGAAF
jgi:type III secretion protein V